MKTKLTEDWLIELIEDKLWEHFNVDPIASLEIWCIAIARQSGLIDGLMSKILVWKWWSCLINWLIFQNICKHSLIQFFLTLSLLFSTTATILHFLFRQLIRIFPVRPGKPQNLNLRGLSNTSLVLTYDVPNEMQEFPPGLVQHIQVSNQHEPGKWTVRDTIMDSQDKKVLLLFFC